MIRPINPPVIIYEGKIAYGTINTYGEPSEVATNPDLSEWLTDIGLMLPCSHLSLSPVRLWEMITDEPGGRDLYIRGKFFTLLHNGYLAEVTRDYYSINHISSINQFVMSPDYNKDQFIFGSLAITKDLEKTCEVFANHFLMTTDFIIEDLQAVVDRVRVHYNTLSIDTHANLLKYISFIQGGERND